MNATNITIPGQTRFPLPLSITLCALGTIVTFENSVIVAASIRSPRLRQNIHHNLVLALSVGDLLLGVSAVSTGARLALPWLSGILPLCIVNVFLQVTGIAMSHFQTFYISFNRFLVITENRLNMVLFNGHRKYILYAVSWTGVMTFIGSIMAPVKLANRKVCNVKIVYGNNYNLFRPIFLSFNALLLGLIIVFYILTLLGVRRRYRKTAPTIPTESTSQDRSVSVVVNQRDKMEKLRTKRFVHSMKLVSIILGALMIFSGPIVFVNLSRERPHTIIISTLCATTFNSLINPIIYSWQISELRQEIRKMFRLA
ncbi:G-protein coupled receptor 12-like [Saccostrea echinata]|uniref:G-protein coupled receptor 12-like n=1 Tax=Saccostrea echinata TaxID=191078 RepID=UPI002A83619B|nr:G-protein coupled receptor 12-like [Saccostrea echinata]